MKILHINDNYDKLGGAEEYLLSICNSLEETGHKIVIISSSERNTISVKGRREYFLGPSYGIRSTLGMWKVYRDIVEKERPDVIHLHNTQYFLGPYIIKKLSRLRPTVKFVHDVRFFCPTGKKVIPRTQEICNYPMGISCFNRKGCYPFSVNRGSTFDSMHKFFFLSYELKTSMLLHKIIVGSSYMYNELVRNGFESDKIKIIPCYTDKIYNKGGGEGEKGHILFIGRYEREKGFMEFIESLCLIKDQQWRAEVVGDDRFVNDSEDIVRRSGLNERIKFRGRLSGDELQRCYSQCSLVVMPSTIPESFGLVGIEAMALGKPVVAFNLGGIKDWLVDGETGFLVEGGDKRALAEKISLILQDQSLAKKMGKKCMERVDSLYRKESHLKTLLSVYDEAIKTMA